MSIWINKKKDDEGFTLIELLVVVIIIGILAAIAIPVFLNQRENAWRGAAESDARNAAIEVESFLTQNASYPDSDEWDTLYTAFITSNGVGLEYEVDGNAYAISAFHDNLEGGEEVVACYLSGQGGIVRPVPADGCEP